MLSHTANRGCGQIAVLSQHRPAPNRRRGFGCVAACADLIDAASKNDSKLHEHIVGAGVKEPKIDIYQVIVHTV